MKIMWTVNICFPEVAEQLGKRKTNVGGWLYKFREFIKRI